MTRRPWTRKEEQLALELYEQGHKGIIIARRLCRTYSSTRQRITLLRKRNGTHIPVIRYHRAGELLERVRKLALPGIPDTAIALILGINRTAVQRARSTLGIPPCKLNYSYLKTIKRLTGERLPTKQLHVAVILCSAANNGLGIPISKVAMLTGHSRQNIHYTQISLGIRPPVEQIHTQETP